QKAAENKSLQLRAQWLKKTSTPVEISGDKLLLPARTTGFNWMFSIQNTFDWDFGNRTLSAGNWQWMLFGGLFIFFILVLITSLVTPADKLSWVWQLLSCITLVLLTTRFFLFWRYKSFPPYEGMDLPSQQQLSSFWNFGIIIFATVILALLFGFGFIRYAWTFIRQQVSKNNNGFSKSRTEGLRDKADTYL